MDCRPSKYSFYNTIVLSMNIHAHRWSDLMIGATITSYIDVTLVGNIIYKPADLVCMSLNPHLVRCLRINNSNGCAIHINKLIIDIGLKIIEPYLLPRRFETSR